MSLRGLKSTCTEDLECVKTPRSCLGGWGEGGKKRTKGSVMMVKLLRAREGSLIRTRKDENWV